MSLWHLIRHGEFDHEMQNGRDPLGRLTTTCARCGFTRLVLCDDTIIGPAHVQKSDIGAVRTKAVTDKVAKMPERKRA